MSFVKSITAALAGVGAALAASANAAVLVDVTGEYYDSFTGIFSNADAQDIIDAASGPTATWLVSSGIDYPTIGTLDPVSTSLADFLGADAATLSGAGSNTLDRSVFRFVGFIMFDGTESSISVGSDDGFILNIGGTTVSSFDGLREFATTTVASTFDAGIYMFELIYFENDGVTGVEFAVDGMIVNAATPVPLPAAALFMATGLAGFLARRKSQA